MVHPFQAIPASTGVLPTPWMPAAAGPSQSPATGNSAAANVLLQHLNARFGDTSAWMPYLDSAERFFRSLPEEHRELLHTYLFPANAERLSRLEACSRNPQAMAEEMVQPQTVQSPVDAEFTATPRPARQVVTSAAFSQPPAAFQQFAPVGGWPVALGAGALPAHRVPTPGGAWLPPPINPPIVVLNRHPSDWGAANFLGAASAGIGLGAGLGLGLGGGWGGYSPYPCHSMFASPPYFGGFGSYGGWGGFGGPGGFGGFGGDYGVGGMLAGAAVGGLAGGVLGAAGGGLFGGAIGAGLGALAYGFL
ncbi:hypothetical protein SAMN05216359_10694 [Roseateles sp. YR242]|nr:hypothetical protein SAMN05216359_10694 [Roseateles sp. YR242]